MEFVRLTFTNAWLHITESLVRLRGAPPWQRRASRTHVRPGWVHIGYVVMLAVTLFNAILIVQSLNLYHSVAVTTPLNGAVAMQHARDVRGLEQSLSILIEPAVQQQLSQGIATPWGMLSGSLVRTWAAWLYINAVPSWLFAALVWSYLFRREHFAWLRDLTIISAFLSVICYRVYPLAPPRFALASAPYQMQDWTYGSTSVDSHIMSALGFNPYAAFPSVHLVWALIPTICLLVGTRPFWAWLVAPLFPVVMAVTIISTGNHYVVDCLGAVLVLCISALITLRLQRCRRWVQQWLVRRNMRLQYSVPKVPPIPAFALVCAGMLAVVGVNMRVWMALNIVVLLAAAAYRCRALLHATAGEPRRCAVMTHCDCLAGVLFIAGATAVTHSPSRDAALCAFLWLLACLSAIAGYRYAATAQARPPVSQALRRRADRAGILRPLIPAETQPRR